MQATNPIQVLLPNYNHRFDIITKSKRTLFSSIEWPSFFISKNQFVPLLKTKARYLFLENLAGEKMVLLFSDSVYSFKMDSHGELQSHSIISNIKLAYAYLISNKIRSAKKILLEKCIKLSKYSKVEIGALVHLLETSHDACITLVTFYVLFENLSYYSPKTIKSDLLDENAEIHTIILQNFEKYFSATEKYKTNLAIDFQKKISKCFSKLCHLLSIKEASPLLTLNLDRLRLKAEEKLNQATQDNIVCNIKFDESRFNSDCQGLSNPFKTAVHYEQTSFLSRNATHDYPFIRTAYEKMQQKQLSNYNEYMYYKEKLEFLDDTHFLIPILRVLYQLSLKLGPLGNILGIQPAFELPPFDELLDIDIDSTDNDKILSLINKWTAIHNHALGLVAAKKYPTQLPYTLPAILSVNKPAAVVLNACPISNFNSNLNITSVLKNEPLPIPKEVAEDLLKRIAITAASFNDKLTKRELNRIHQDIINFAATYKKDKITIAKEGFIPLLSHLQGHSENYAKQLKTMEDAILQLINKIPSNETEIPIRLKIKSGDYLLKQSIQELIPLYLQKDKTLYQKENACLTDAEINSLDKSITEFLLVATEKQRIERAIKCAESFKDYITGTKKIANEEEVKKKIEDFYFELTSTRSYKDNIVLHPEYLVFEYHNNFLLRKDQVENLDKLLNDKNQQENVLQMIMGSGKTKVLLPLTAYKRANGLNLSIIMLPENIFPTISRILQLECQKMFDRKAVHINWDGDSVKSLKQIYHQLKHVGPQKAFLIMTDKEMHLFMLKFRELQLQYKNLGKYLKKCRIESILSDDNPSHSSEIDTDSSLDSSSDDEVDSEKNMNIAMPKKNKNKIDLEMKLVTYRKIFALLKKLGYLMMDEVDTSLNHLHEVHVSSSDLIKINSDRIDLTVFLYETLLTDNQICNKMSFDFFDSNNQNSLLFTPSRYQNIKPHFVKQLIEKIKTEEHESSILKDLKTLLCAQDKIFNETAIDYLLEDKTKSDLFTHRLLSLAPDVKDAFAFLKEFINHTAPFTFSENHNEHYGLFPDNNDPNFDDLAGPYECANKPKIGSRFGNYRVLLNCTTQTYIKIRLPLKFIQKEIKTLKNKCAVELSLPHRPSLKDTKAFKAFLYIFGAKWQPVNLLTISQMEMENILSDLNNSTIKVLQFLKRFVLKKISYLGKHYGSDSQNLLAPFRNVNGYSGTHMNKDTYHDRLTTHMAPGVDGKTIFILYHKNKHSIKFVDGNNSEQLLKDLSDRMDLGQANALIDVGALFKNITNKKLALAILNMNRFKQGPNKIRAVIYFSGDNLFILKEGQTKATAYFQHDIPPEQCFTYYDQRHCTGTDIVQSTTALAWVTLNKNILLRDLLQGPWRMRGLDRAQTIMILMPKEMDSIVRNTLNIKSVEEWCIELLAKPIETKHCISLILEYLGSSFEANAGHPLDILDLVLYSSINCTSHMPRNNLLSVKHKMRDLVLQTCDGILNHIPLKHHRHPDLAPLYSLYESIVEDAPYKQFGMLEQDLDVKDILQQYKLKLLAPFALLVRLPENFISQQILSMVGKLDAIIQKALSPNLSMLPDRMTMRSEAADNATIEFTTTETVEVQMDQETAVNYYDQNKHKQVALYVPWKESHNIFNSRQFFIDNKVYSFVALIGSAAVLKFLTPTCLLYGTHNFFVTTTQPQAFDFHQKDFDFMMIRQPINIADTYQFILLCAKEADKLRSLLIQDKTTPINPKGSRNVNVCLYHMRLGVVQQGRNPINIAAMEKPDTFKILLLKLKWLGATFIYTRTEIELLFSLLTRPEFLSHAEIVEIETFFKQVILGHKPELQKEYENTVLASVFNEALQLVAAREKVAAAKEQEKAEKEAFFTPIFNSMLKSKKRPDKSDMAAAASALQYHKSNDCKGFDHNKKHTLNDDDDPDVKGIFKWKSSANSMMTANGIFK